MTVDGPHVFEVHTLGKYCRLDCPGAEGERKKGTNEVTGEQGQRHKQDGGNGQRPHNLVHLV